MKHRLFILLVILLATLVQSTDLFSAGSTSAYIGTHFFVGFMQNENYYEEDLLQLQQQLFIATTQPAQVTVKLPKKAFLIYLSLPANTIYRMKLDYEVQDTVSEVPMSLGIEINSDVPVSVNLFSSRPKTSDSYTAIPVDQWGTEYVAMSFPNDQYTILNSEPRPSEFMVIAAYDGTVIEFQPRSVTKLGKQTYNTYTQILNKGECYLVQSFDAGMGQADLTGTIVRGNKPFGFISGHVRTAVPQFMPRYQNSKDHLIEMLMPVKSWGRRFVSTPFLKPGVDNLGRVVNPLGDLFRVTSIYDSTIVTIETDSFRKDYYLNSPGDFVTIPNIVEPALWISNRPVQIGQYMARAKDQSQDHGYYDPFLVMLPPVELFTQNIFFAVPGDILPKEEIYYPDQFLVHNITLLIHERAIASLRLDEKPVKDTPGIIFKQILNTPYYWTIISLDTGNHRITSAKSGFVGLSYGYGKRDSYGMVLGSELKNPYENDNDPPRLATDENCGKVNGTVYETLNPSNSGIDYVYILADSTYNYTVDIDPVTDTSTYITFRAAPDDIFQDGRFVIDYRDRNGNGGRYSYFYNHLNVDMPDTSVTFYNVNFTDSLCRVFYVVNNGLDTVEIREAVLSGDARLKTYLDPELPRMLAPGESLEVEICFDPEEDTAELDARILFRFKCDFEHTVKIKGSVMAPQLDSLGYDFGNVLVGDTVCSDVLVINKGNVPIRIDSIIIPRYSIRFWPDTSGMFPVDIKRGDTLRISICFNPDNIDTLNRYIIIVKNNYDIQLQVSVTGKGVAPRIKNLYLDWKNRRVGTTNDTTLYLYNTGNTSTVLSFIKFTDTTTTDRATDIIQDMNITIPARDSVPIDLYYDPIDTTAYRIVAEMGTGWRLHPAITFEIDGQGTIPTIEPFDVEFDTTIVYTGRSKTVGIILSGGNEQLTIDEIVQLSGDASSFEIDYPALKNLVLLPDSLLEIPIRFYPTRIGRHRLLLGITNDAMPNYQRRTDTVIIIGDAILADTAKVISELSGGTGLIACDSTFITVTYTNNGNVPLKFMDIEINSGNIYAERIGTLTFPAEDSLQPGSSISSKIKFITSRDQTGTIEIIAEFRHKEESFFETNSYFADPWSLPLGVTSEDGLEYTPGDSIVIIFTGAFPNKAEKKIDFKLNIDYNRTTFYLLNKTAELIITDPDKKRTIPLRIDRSINKLSITNSGDDFFVRDSTTWSMKLSFLVLLDNEPKPEFEIRAYSDNCFQPNSSKILAHIGGVCSFNLRAVKLITNLVLLNVSPNPVRDNLNLDLFLPENETLELYVININGESKQLTSNLNLKKGSHSLIFDISYLPSGFYLLSLQGTKFIMKRKFIITK